MKITSSDKDVQSILTSYYYCIPRFQRPFRWVGERVNDYLNDTLTDVQGDYFIGSMVVYKIRDSFGIVDGQQRLTTITMMLCAIRNALQKEGFQQLAAGVHRLIERENIENKPCFVLSTETSFPYFQEYIQKFGQPIVTVTPKVEEKNLKVAFQQITLFVEDAIQAIKRDPTINEDEKPHRIKDKLVQLRDKTLSPKLIFVELENQDDAYIIFETMNSRGENLGVSDLVKSHFTRLLRPKNQAVDTARIQWERIVQTIEESSVGLSVDTFLHHYWLSEKEYTTKEKLYRAIKKEVKRASAQDYLNRLEKDAVTYREINDTAYKTWQKIDIPLRDSLNAFILFKVKQEIPMVLALMREYKRRGITRKALGRILKEIERFHFVFTAVTSQRSSGGISQMYANAAKLFTSASSDGAKMPSYEEFRLDFNELVYTSKISKQKDIVKYILAKYHAYLCKGTVTNYDLMTIEHIMPEKKVGNDRIDDTDIGRIGNLMLVPPKLNNENLADKPFDEKKRILLGNNVTLDDVLVKAESWKKDDIDKRTEQIAKAMYELVWNGNRRDK